MSLAVAGRRAAVLRGAGLVDTVRAGTAVPHALTPLGRAAGRGPKGPFPAPARAA
ncbi:hypothetical protein GCM10010282_62870 [Streptomyces roseolus]|nr:hypothetical protein GCM10010282_62870 [Streptomyces roseolus]